MALSSSDTGAILSESRSALGDACRSVGRPVRTYGNATVLLSDPELGLYVVDGSVDLFAVTLDAAGQPTGRRTYLRTLEAGDMAFGVDPALTLVPMGFLVAGNVHSEVVALEAPLRTLPDRRFLHRELANAVDRWVAGLSEAVGAYVLPMPTTDARLTPGDTAPVPANERVTAREGVAWVEDAGQALWCDTVELYLDGQVFPLHGAAWLAPFAGTVVRVSATSDLLAESRLGQGLGNLHAATLEALTTNLGLVSADELNRQRERVQRDARLLQGSLQAAASVGERTPHLVQGGDGADTLTEAVTVVARALGAPPPQLQAHEQRLADDDRLVRLLASSSLRSRLVTLEGNWWKYGGSPLIASAENGTPLALLPTRRSGYQVHDPETGALLPLGRRLAETVTPTARAVYQSLPRREVGARDLLAISLGGSARDYAALFAFALIAALVGLLTPYLTGVLVNDAIPYSDRGVVMQLTGILIAVASTTAILRFLQATMVLRIDSTLGARAEPALWDRVLGLPTDMLRQHSIGDFAQRVTALTQIRSILSQGVAMSVISGVVSLASLVNLIVYGGWLSLVAVAVILLTVLLNGVANLIQVRKAREAIALQADLSGAANQALRSIAKLRIAGATDRVLAQLVGRHADYRHVFYGSRLAEAFVRTVNMVTAQLGMLAIYLSVEFLFGYDKLLPGDFVAFFVALGTLNGGVSGLLNAVTSGLMARVFYQRLEPILTTVTERRTDSLNPGALSGRIEVNDVTFRYYDGGPAVLDGVDLAVEPGQFVAIVGGSGSGKSTLLRLLLGFDAPESGSILYDGKDLSKLDLTAVRRQFGVVLQNSQPLGGSVRDNVAGTHSLTDDEVWSALEKVGLAADIDAMPMKLETVVNDGSTISGGQRQRVMLARAIAGNPRVIFMDEATSALDNRTQAIVTDSLGRMPVTRVVIAHRLTTVKDADLIVVLDAGRVVESGAYEALIARDGAFAALARRQIL